MDPSLLCCESSRAEELRARVDLAIIKDDRVLENLLQTEDGYIPTSSYFDCIQRGKITPKMRKIVTNWMFEVCADQHCLEEVFPLAVNMMDRYLSTRPVTPACLQLVCVTCILAASKLRDPDPVPVSTLALYTDNSVTPDQIVAMERLLCETLRYDLLAVTAPDFLYPIVARLPIKLEKDNMVLRHASTLVALCARDKNFMQNTPSLIAGGCVIAALQGLPNYRNLPSCKLPALLDTLHRLLGIEKDYLHSCYRQVEQMMSVEFPMETEPPLHAMATTPTDVDAIHF